MEYPQAPEQRDVSATMSVPGLIWPTRRSKKNAERASGVDVGQYNGDEEEYEVQENVGQNVSIDYH